MLDDVKPCIKQGWDPPKIRGIFSNPRDWEDITKIFPSYSQRRTEGFAKTFQLNCLEKNY